MELSEKYVYKVYETGTFSAAARALFVSQPALSTTVARLERELGFQIFDRSSIPLTPTPRGRIYIEYLEDMMLRERHMKLQLQALSEATRGTLSIGGLCHTAYSLLSAACGVFFERYPEVVVNISMGNTANFGSLVNAIKSHSLDLVMTYNYDPREFEAVPLIEEQLVIAVNRSLPEVKKLLPLAVTREELLRKSYPPEKEITDFSIFKDLRFLSCTKVGNTVNRLMDRLEGNYTLSTYHIRNTEHLTMHYNMIHLGLGAHIVSNMHVREPLFQTEDIIYLIPKCEEAHRTLRLVMKHEDSENPIIKNFISVTREICNRIKADPLQ